MDVNLENIIYFSFKSNSIYENNRSCGGYWSISRLDGFDAMS